MQPNIAISHLMEEFAQIHSKVLNSINALMQVHSNVFESPDFPQEPSLTSTNFSSLTQTQAINSTIQNDTNELKEMI